MGVQRRLAARSAAMPALLLFAVGAGGSGEGLENVSSGLVVVGVGDGCRVTLSPTEVSAERSPVTLEAFFSEEVGEMKEAHVEEESGIEVLSIEPNPPREAKVTLVTRNGSRGDWLITFRAETGRDCVGRILVTSDGRSVSR